MKDMEALQRGLKTPRPPSVAIEMQILLDLG